MPPQQDGQNELDMPTQWRSLLVLVPVHSTHLQHVLATYFNLELDPKINLDAAKWVMPKADDKMLKDIAKHFKQLSWNIKAEMANGNGHPLLADSTPVHVAGSLPMASRRLLQQQGATTDIRPSSSAHLTRIKRNATHTKTGATTASMPPTVTRTVVEMTLIPATLSVQNANTANYSKGVFIWVDPNKGIGIINNSTTKIPNFEYKGGDREVYIKFFIRGCNSCTFGNHCNKFHLTEIIFLNFETEKQDQVDV
jgi:hypothetical protein